MTGTNPAEATLWAAGIPPVDEQWRLQALQRLDTLTKPPGSLGSLEALAAQFVAIRGERWDEPIKKGVYIFAADHGVTAEGVSAYPSEVTRQMVLNFLGGGAAVNVLARQHGASLYIIDVGVDTDFGPVQGLLHCKIARGTRNLRYHPAMTDSEFQQALAVGAEMADHAAAGGEAVIAIGEMGIGNTTAASAITCALTGAPPSFATGRGTGVDGAAHSHKISVVEHALALHFGGTLPAAPLQALRCVGGLEIAAMAGMMLAAARHRIMVVVDGFISTAAAAIAAALCPEALGYMVAGHRSQEPGHAILLEHLGLSPLLALDMRLGEGTGAVLAFSLIESAVALLREMATFSSAGISGIEA